jgi:hypothetical protein
MDMCRHNAEVCKPETEFVFRGLQYDEHDFPAQFVFKNPNFVISAAGYVVKGPFGEFVFFSHGYPSITVHFITARACILLWFFRGKKRKIT